MYVPINFAKKLKAQLKKMRPIGKMYNYLL